MKKFAMSTLEVLIALSLIAAATVLGMNTLHIYINKDTDIVKFKHAFATFSEVIVSLKADTCMYPNIKGFAYTDVPDNCINKNDSFNNKNKFKKLFSSKFNILENNVELSLSSQVPVIKYENSSNSGLYKINNKIKCFVENKGFMFCPPETVLGSNEKLLSIYVPVYINKIDLDNSKTWDINKAIFIEVAKNGKLEIPPVIEYYPNRAIIDCTKKEYNNYSHCKVLDKMLDVEF